MKLNPYLTFDGNCREAMEFYKECLGGELELMTVEQSGQAENIPDKKDQIMHGSLTSDGIVLMASDMIMEGEIKQGNTMTLCLNRGSKEEMEELFKKFSEGAKIETEFGETFFGYYGALEDKFGFRWMFQADKSE
jgi:PhnB protein